MVSMFHPALVFYGDSWGRGTAVFMTVINIWALFSHTAHVPRTHIVSGENKRHEINEVKDGL